MMMLAMTSFAAVRRGAASPATAQALHAAGGTGFGARTNRRAGVSLLLAEDPGVLRARHQVRAGERVVALHGEGRVDAAGETIQPHRAVGDPALAVDDAGLHVCERAPGVGHGHPSIG